MIELEPMADEFSRIFMSKMDRMEGEDVDLGTWLQWYAFDFVTSVTFSERLGFMEQETDVAQIIDVIEGRLAYNAIIGRAPYLHKFLLGNSFVKTITSSLKAMARLNSAQRLLCLLQSNLKSIATQKKSLTSPKDMLARFKRSRDWEVLITDKQVLAHVSANIFAGSDTAAIGLRAIINFLCKNPTCYQDAVAELDKFDRDGELSDPVKFNEAIRMPYLQACIKEAMRLHPSGGQMLERGVPEGGSTLSGVYLQEGTIVGMNPWVTSRDEVVYGSDVNEFRPDRWLMAEPSKLQAMERNFLAFGAGSRTCIGRNASLLEISKLIPQLLRRYDIHLSRPDAELTLTGFFFVKQTGLCCRLTRREHSS